MSSVIFKGSSYPIRTDLDDTHKNAWVSISSAVTWLTGAQRIAITNEIREVLRRPVCANTREALSPESVPILNLSND